MPRKSFWATLIFAMLLACFASIRTAPTAAASPAHAAHHNARLQYVSACPSGQHMLVELSAWGSPSVFGNYYVECTSVDDCAASTGNVLVCLYQNANYGGQEIEFIGQGCANLTDFAGPGSNGTWNDTMSSFRIDANSGLYGAFWWDTNDNGYYYLFGPPGSGRVSATTYVGNTWNDQASSLQLDPNPGGC